MGTWATCLGTGTRQRASERSQTSTRALRGASRPGSSAAHRVTPRDTPLSMMLSFAALLPCVSPEGAPVPAPPANAMASARWQRRRARDTPCSAAMMPRASQPPSYAPTQAQQARAHCCLRVGCSSLPRAPQRATTPALLAPPDVAFWRRVHKQHTSPLLVPETYRGTSRWERSERRVISATAAGTPGARLPWGQSVFTHPMAHMHAADGAAHVTTRHAS